MSASETKVQAINCTACGATLDVMGGHRVKSLTCGYCGSVMDRHAGYQVLQRYRDSPERPYAPLTLGMEATLKGVPFAIIGMIRYVSHQSGPGWAESYDWISFQLYSPTHGYGWLTWNKGHYLFSYRTRDMPYPVTPRHLMPKSPVRLEGRKFKMFERYAATIDYVEGELTWIAKRGDEVHVVEAIDPPAMFSYERGENELEYSIGEYMEPAEVHAAFGIDPPGRPEGVHPAQPFRPSALLEALSKIGPIFAGVAILGLFLVLTLGGGREIVRSTIDDPSASAWLVSFTVTDADRLVKIELESPVRNNWVYYELTVNNAETEEPVLFLGQEISYYEGRDSDGRWTEGSRRADALFKLPAPGDYELAIDASEIGHPVPRVELGLKRPQADDNEVGLVASEVFPPLEVRIHDRVMVKRYAVILLILSIVAFAHSSLHAPHLREAPLGGRAGGRRR